MENNNPHGHECENLKSHQNNQICNLIVMSSFLMKDLSVSYSFLLNLTLPKWVFKF